GKAEQGQATGSEHGHESSVGKIGMYDEVAMAARATIAQQRPGALHRTVLHRMAGRPGRLAAYLDSSTFWL
ncbi:hypothetical protein AB4142_32835, partial [Variovorax sp. 2RAF20]